MIKQTISNIHLLIIAYFFLFPYITPLYYLPKVICFFYFVILHWYWLDGQCILTIIENMDKEKKQDVISPILLKYGLPKTILDVIVHTNFIVSFYRLDRIMIGIIYLNIIIFLNKIIYGHCKFKWSD
jgi:hypothetical protein